MVKANIYDLDSASSYMNPLLRSLGTGIFHVGIEVYGQEYSYGSNGTAESTSTGITCCKPRGCSAHMYRETIELGETSLSEDDVQRLLLRLSEQWLQKDYDMLCRNCCNFSEDFARELGVHEVPLWTGRLARIGSSIMSSTRSSDSAQTETDPLSWRSTRPEEALERKSTRCRRAAFRKICI
jgi:hypothetical protein